jgi:hypothetical protein
MSRGRIMAAVLSGLATIPLPWDLRVLAGTQL